MLSGKLLPAALALIGLASCGEISKVESLREEGKLDQAIAVCEEQIQGRSADPAAYKLLAELMKEKILIEAAQSKSLSAGLFADAIRAGTQAQSVDPNDPTTSLNLGVIYLKTAEYVQYSESPDLNLLWREALGASWRLDWYAQEKSRTALYLLEQAKVHLLVAADRQPPRGEIISAPEDVKAEAIRNLQVVQSALAQLPAATVLAAPLLMAAGNGDIPQLKNLLARGADPDTKGAGDETPLHRAAEYAQEASAKVLLGAGADVNARMEFGLTPLHIAVVSPAGPPFSCNREMAMLLIYAGAGIDIKSDRGVTPLDLARSNCSVEYVELFMRHTPSAKKAPSFTVLLEHGEHTLSTKVGQLVISAAAINCLPTRTGCWSEYFTIRNDGDHTFLAYNCRDESLDKDCTTPLTLFVVTPGLEVGGSAELTSDQKIRLGIIIPAKPLQEELRWGDDAKALEAIFSNYGITPRKVM